MIKCKNRELETYRMPIEISKTIRVIQEPEFHNLAHRVIGLAFEIHNEFGRFLGEDLCKVELAKRCENIGLGSIELEVRLRLRHQGFRKDYFADLLVGGALIVEAKSVEGLAPAHHAQTLNYLLLAGVHHGLLINFRTSRVEHRYVSTSLNHEARREFHTDVTRWDGEAEEARFLREEMTGLLEDWGLCLEIAAYREALAFLLGGEDRVRCPVPVRSGGNVIGNQALSLLNPHTAYTVTAVGEGKEDYEDHLLRFLRHTTLDCLHWINLDYHEATFITLHR